MDASAGATLPEFKCWEEQWELEARKDTAVNRFKIQDKFVGMY